MGKYDLYCPFDIEMHKKTFINYFETVIYPDGTVEYAVPSHQEKLIAIYCEKFNCTREEMNKQMPTEYYLDVNTWLCNMTGCISVWNDFYYKSDTGPITEQQRKTLEELKEHGIYKGEI